MLQSMESQSQTRLTNQTAKLVFVSVYLSVSLCVCVSLSHTHTYTHTQSLPLSQSPLTNMVVLRGSGKWILGFGN